LRAVAPNTTATEQIIRAGKRASRLTYFIQALHDCFEQAVQIHAQWIGLGVDDGGEITMGTTGNELILTAQDIAALNNSVSIKAMSRLEFSGIMQRAGIYPDDYDFEADMEQIKKEADDFAPPIPTLSVGKSAPFAQDAHPAIGAMFNAKQKAKQKAKQAVNGNSAT